MKNSIKLFSLFFFFISVSIAYSQTGTVAGNVIDGDYNNEPLAFANVIVKGTATGTTSDFDGKYELELEEGTYTLIFSFVGYNTQEITEVIIKSGEVFDLDVTLGANTLDEVLITTSAKRNTESAVLDIQKRSVSLVDGLSAQSIKKSGAGDLAAAVKSIPGVSVEGGKYVYVRGLGDRYTKSILNGVDIPGLDPDRNTIQMDIFPTNILDNVIVIKSAAAEYPADFTGGVINIVTKDFPTRAEYSVSAGFGYNPDMHFNDNYLSYSGGNTDFFGYDDGTRKVPVNRYQPIPGTFDINSGLLTQLTGRFDKQLRAQQENSNPNFDFGFTAGNQYDVGDNNKIGYLASFSYKNGTTFYEDRRDGAFVRDIFDTSNNELIVDRSSIGSEGINNVLLNGLAGLTFKTNLSKYKFTVMHIQNGESSSGFFNQNIAQGGGGTGVEPLTKDALLYTERSVTNLLLNGTHSFGPDNNWELDWKFSPTFSKVYDKDHRVTPLQESQDGQFFITPSASTFPIRIWRFLLEESWAAKIDLSKKYTLFNKPAKVKFGGGYTYKFRDFSVDDFTFETSTLIVPGGDPNNLLVTQNLWTRDNQSGTFLRFNNNFNPNDAYEGEQFIYSTYISNEFNLSENFKTILGLRTELFNSFYTGQDGNIIFIDEPILDEFDFFPSANLIYALTDESNLRGSYYRTTARPSFKEASVSQIFDPITDRLFIGNIDLVPTYVNNFDLRYENFGLNGEMFAISGFYKDFKDPIELTFFLEAPTQLQPRNLGNAKVYGAEIEFRKNLGFISDGLKNMRFNMNASLIESRLTMSDPEFNSRTSPGTLRDGETVDRERDLQGQSPYLINAGLEYVKNESGLQTGLYFNIQGETLEVVGTGITPDVYSVPFESLNFTFNKAFGKNKKSSIDLKVTNILGAERESVFRSFGAIDQIFSLRRPGTEFSVGYSYKF